MRARALSMFGLAGIAWLIGASTTAAVAAERAPARPSVVVAPEDASQARVIVKYKADSRLMQPLSAGLAASRPQHAATLSTRLSLPLADGRVLGARTQALRGAGLSSTQLAARLAAQADVEWAVPDRRRRWLALPNDPYLGPAQTSITPAAGQWYLRAPDTNLISAIDAVGAWAMTLGSASVTVAVLDTGVRFDHPDLAGKLHPGQDFVSEISTANDGGGRDGDASDPGDWTTHGECGLGEPAETSSWHGTQVAGLVGAATDNGQGMAGVGYRTMVLPVRVLGRCGGLDSDIIAAMRWAAGLSRDPTTNAHPARVLNLSLGSSGSCDPSYADVVAELVAAGVTVVAAAGNETGLAVGVPANCPGAIAVSGVRHIGTKVGYSSLGPEVAIAAPAGNCVNLVGTCLYPLLSTSNAGATAPAAPIYSDGDAHIGVGTSFSAPLVAGTAALMLSVDPSLTPAQIREALQASARRFPSSGADAGVAACRAPNGIEQDECYCTTSTCGAGLLDAAAAVTRVLPPASAPTVRVAAAPAVAVGSSLTLNAQDASAYNGRSIVAYHWTITAGADAASLSGDTNAASVTLLARATGRVSVSLTVTDSIGATGTSSATIEVQAATTGGTAGGGGGGALGLGWLAGLGAAVWALRRRRAAR